MQYLGAISKMTEWSLFISKVSHSIQSHPGPCPDQQCWKSWSWMVLWRPTRPSKTNTPKCYPFHYRDWNTIVGSQETPGVTGKFGLGVWNEAGQRLRVLPKEHTGNNKHPLPTTQKKTLYMDITRWSTLKSGWLYSLQPKMEKFYTVSKHKTRSWLWLRSWTPYCKIQT